VPRSATQHGAMADTTTLPGSRRVRQRTHGAMADTTTLPGSRRVRQRTAKGDAARAALDRGGARGERGGAAHPALRGRPTAHLAAWAIGVTHLYHLPTLLSTSVLRVVKARSVLVMASQRGSGVREVIPASWPRDADYAVAAFNARRYLGLALVGELLPAPRLGVGSSQVIFHPKRTLSLVREAKENDDSYAERQERQLALADSRRCSFLHTDATSSLLIVFRGHKRIVMSRKPHAPGSPDALKVMPGYAAGRYLQGDAIALAEAHPDVYVVYILTGNTCLFIPQGHVHCVYSVPNTLAISLDVEADTQFLCSVASSLTK